MLRILLLISLLRLIINAGNTNALDEGSFLWAQRRAENVSCDKRNEVRPGRWTRSVFNWLHSPLINSIQEAFVADSIYDNSPPATKFVKRSVIKNASGMNLEGSFENEFFLWEDNEGNPLEFGLKQIQEVMPSSQPMQDIRRFNRSRNDTFEEPLVYEYNHDAKDVDTNHLSFHEKFKLNDILKNKLHNAFHHVFTFKHSTKHPSIYYTLGPSTNVSSTTNCSTGLCSIKNSSNQEYVQPLVKSLYKSSPTSSGKIKNEQNSVIETSSKDAIGKQWSSYELSESKSESPYYLFSSDIEGNKFTELTTLTSPDSKNQSSVDAQNFISENSKDNFDPLKPWLNFHEVKLDEEETPYFLNDNVNNHGPMKSCIIQKNSSDEASNHRKLRNAHRKRFLRRKNKRKNNKLKFSDGHSFQYELFNGKFKSSGK